MSRKRKKQKTTKRLKRIHDKGITNINKMKNSLVSATDGQKDYIITMVENEITFCTGPAGSGKSYCATGIACQELFSDKSVIDRIVITRPIVGLGRKSMGSLPGTMEEKMAPYISPIEKHLIYFLGNDLYNKLRNEKRIKIAPLEYMRGETFDNSFVLLDEAQNADYSELKMFITRFGEGSKMVLNGDVKQTDLDYYDDEENDFARIIRWVKGKSGFGVSVLENKDIVRAELVARFLDIIELKEKEERFKG